MQRTSARAVVAALSVFASALARADTAGQIRDFEGVEEPAVVYKVSTKNFTSDTFKNIQDMGNGIVRFALRYRAGDWWDGDRTTDSDDRQRAEVKGIGRHQKTGESFEYSTSWRTDSSFQGTGKFCHVFQLKATDGDNGAPLVVLSVLNGTNTAAVRYCSGDASGFTIARQFQWKPGTWQNVRIRIITSNDNKGRILVSVNGDAWRGVKNVRMYRPDATDYRPKWGLYRGVTSSMPFGDNWVEHRLPTARKL
jgi:hypothetical protein